MAKNLYCRIDNFKLDITNPNSRVYIKTSAINNLAHTIGGMCHHWGISFEDCGFFVYDRKDKWESDQRWWVEQANWSLVGV